MEIFFVLLFFISKEHLSATKDFGLYVPLTIDASRAKTSLCRSSSILQEKGEKKDNCGSKPFNKRIVFDTINRNDFTNDISFYNIISILFSVKESTRIMLPIIVVFGLVICSDVVSIK